MLKHKDFTPTTPLGGQLEVFDIDREQKLLDKEEKCVGCGITDNVGFMYSHPAGYYCEICAEKLGITKPSYENE